MKLFNSKDYLELCQRLIDQQYDDEDEESIQTEWIPSEPEIQQKLIQSDRSGRIDLTNVKSYKIKEELFKHANLKVGDFTIRISRHNNTHIETGLVITCTVQVLEERHKTPNGMPCKIDYPMLFDKDTRFTGRPWLKYFRGNMAFDVPIDVVIDIIRWMQAVEKLTVFL